MVLDNLPPYERKGGVLMLPHQRLTLADAKKVFLSQFPLGFKDGTYIGDLKIGERAYKLAAHERFTASLGGGQLAQLLASGQVAEAASRAQQAVTKQLNLLSPYEAMAFKGYSSP